MAKSRGRKFAEITSPSSGVFDLTSVPTITNAKLQNSAMTLAGSSVSLGGTGVADTDALSEGSSNLYFTNARVQSFLGGGTLAGNVVVPDNRSIYVGSDSDFRIVHNTTNTQLINATGALQVTSNGGFDVTGASTFSSTVAATGNVTAPNLINIATDSTIQTTTAKQWAKIKNTGTGTGDYSEMAILNDNNDYVIMGSIGSNYSSSNDWASSSYIYANRELRIKSQQGLRFYSGGFTHGTNDYMILDSNGKLGLGHVSTLSSTLNVNTEISVGPDSNNRGIINYSSNILSFGTRQSSTNYFNTLRVTSGKVGIGESNPDAPLHITSNTPIISFDESDASQEYRIGSFGGAFAIYDSTDSAYRFTINGDGNVGIGVTPSASHYKTLELGNVGCAITGRGPADTHFLSGLYWDAASTHKYAVSGVAVGKYQITNGIHYWSSPAAGTAGNAATVSASMTLTADGRLGIGTTTPASYDTNSGGISADLVVANAGHAGIVVASGTGSDAGIFFGDGTGSAAYRGAVSYVHNQERLYFKANGTNHLTLDSTRLNAMGINLDVGVDTATVNFTDSVSNGNTKYIEIGANGSSSLGDALLVTHSSGSGVGYFGYESGNDRLIIACDNGGGNNKIDLSINAGTGTGGSTDNLNAATPALRVHGNGNVGIHGVTDPRADLHVGHGGQEWRTTHGGSDLYIANTNWGSKKVTDPEYYNIEPHGILVTSTSSNTQGPDKTGLVLYNNDNTANGYSPMLVFAKAESGISPYKASMAAIYARAPLGTGNGTSWIDGELIFATAGAASNGVRSRMILEKEGHLRPTLDNNYDLGTTSYRWRNVYTTDLHLSNKVPEGTTGTDGEPIDAGNDVDGTTGDWTIQEGAENLYIINNSTGKKYKFNLTEV